MRRSRASLSIVFLVLWARLAGADTLTVNTTTDDFQANDLCSLREAVEYFNRGKPEGGFQGCVAPGTDAGAVINLPADDAPYLIQGSPITVRTGLSINGDGRQEEGSITEIKVEGRHRAFVVNHTPQWLPPACPGGCASSPAGGTAPTLDLVPASDTDAAGDYLTSVSFPDLVGTLPAETMPFSASSYMLRLYRIPAEGDPVEIGRTKVAFATTPMNWTTRAALLATGVFDVGYTLQPLDAGDVPLATPTDLAASPRLRVAVYADPVRLTVRFSQLILSGGCQAEDASDCSGSVDDDTTVTNDPADTANYDATALSFTNGLVQTLGKGGVIYANERVVLFDVLVRHGQANQKGGLVYLGADGALEMADSELREGRAVQGAAVFAEANVLSISASLVTANDMVTMTGPGGAPVLTPTAPGAVVEVATTAVPDELRETDITNSTISGNRGRGLSLRAGASVLSATIVENTGGGLDFNGGDVDVEATILVGNSGGADCANLPVTVNLDYSLVLATAAGGSCPETGNRVITNTPGTADQLMATESDGKCTGAWGMLCPLADNGGPTFVHMPRVLENYLVTAGGIADSFIINRAAAAGCSSIDQRGEPRIVRGCDIGATEVQALPGGSARTGGVIAYGESYTQPVSDDLGDEDLLSAARCEQFFPPQFDGTGRRFPPASLAPDLSRVVPDTYRVRNTADAADAMVSADGCPWEEKAALRGSVSFTAAGDYTYQPASDFHGFDRFDFRVVTTLSALNDLPADRSRLMKGQVFVEPATAMTSEKLGGALDLCSLLLLALAGLGLRRGGQA